MQQSIEPLILLTKKSSRRWSRYVCILVRLLSFSLFFFFQYQMRYGAKNIFTCSFKHFWWKSKSSNLKWSRNYGPFNVFFFQYRSNLQFFSIPFQLTSKPFLKKKSKLHLADYSTILHYLLYWEILLTSFEKYKQIFFDQWKLASARNNIVNILSKMP